jgi:glycosyltransferase involved in cell wall biosynthesis
MKHNVAGPAADLAAPETAEALPPRATPALFRRPRRLLYADWTVQIPFAFWVTEACRPDVLVELGLGRGLSYFTLLEAAEDLGRGTRCTGIDHWKGDRHSPSDPEGGAATRDRNALLRRVGSDCVTADLVGAEAGFAPGSIDLLHVDVEIRERVAASLRNGWLPRLSSRGVLLLHGTRSRWSAPAAAKLLADLRERHPWFEFEAGEGLTLVLVGPDQPESLRDLAARAPGTPAHAAAQEMFGRLGRACQLEAAAEAAGEIDPECAARREAERAMAAALEDRRRTERALADERAARKKLQDEFGRLLAYGRDLEKRHKAMIESETWRATAPVRRLLQLVKGRSAPAAFKPRLGGVSASSGRTRKGSNEQNRISRAFEKSRSGFHDAGFAELRAIAAGSSGLARADRLHVLRCIALLRAENPETRARALETIEAASVWRDDARGPAEAATLRMSLMLDLDRRAQAAELAAAPGAAADHPDFLLLAASLAPLEAGPDEGADRVAAVSRAMTASSNLRLARADAAAPAGIDNLRGADGPETADSASTGSAMKISVIMPAYDCADTIETSLGSILRQSWDDLEILVADDASSDATPDIVAAMAAQDPRIRLIRLTQNGGAYVARNTALAAAQGDLVTCQDADDWSHPERLRRQADHLAANPGLVANVSHWARATPDLRFERRPFSARVIHFNSSSIMFRRAPVIERAGYWDSVRFAGDTEFWRRLKAIFGETAVAEIPQMLAIGRIREGSLSRASASAYHGGKTGARKVYEQAYVRWHEGAPASALRLPFPLETRPFAVPAVMRSGRSVRDHFDAVLISDFRHMGGTTASNQQELIAQSRAGLRTALVQVDRYDFNVSRGAHPDIQALIDAGAVEQLVHGDAVTADVAVVRFPPIFSNVQNFLPEIRPKAVRVVVNQPPRRVAGEKPFYAIETCKANIAAYLGQEGDWVPIGPAVRHALEADGEERHLSPEDWFNIIDVDAWRVTRDGWRADRPVIGRHGRDAAEKWLTQPEDLLGAYPDDGSAIVRVMGGADVPMRTIGRRPANWEVLGFNAMPPRDFLASLDFFVFFPHEGRIEAFGRTVIEAVASGALAILPPVFEPLFGAAALYCAPGDVGSTVARFYADRDAYLAQTAKAEALVRARFGFEQHVARLRRAMAEAEAPDLVHG